LVDANYHIIRKCVTKIQYGAPPALCMVSKLSPHLCFMIGLEPLRK